MRLERWLLGGLVAVVGVWVLASLVPGFPLRQPFEAEGGSLILPLTLVGVPLYCVAVVRYWLLYRQRPAAMLVSLITAFALLAEALVAVSLARGWALSWWVWHVLMVLGFGFVAYSAHVQYRREGSARSLFASVSLEQTLRDMREEHRQALTSLVDAMRRDGDGPPPDVGPIAARLGERFGLTEAQAAVLEGAAEATYEVDRLRRQLDALLRSYLSPDVAQTLIEDPQQAELGGAIREVTVLFADLRGFTPFSETRSPAEVVEMLNGYFRRAVPLVLDHGGTVVQFIGDALMAVFNAPRPLPDHALHAARAALAMQRSAAEAAADHPDWPQFRIGVNTGPALIGNVGGEVRSFTVIGDATNLAARLEAVAEPGRS